jgi:hypothetical protein
MFFLGEEFFVVEVSVKKQNYIIVICTTSYESHTFHEFAF